MTTININDNNSNNSNSMCEDCPKITVPPTPEFCQACQGLQREVEVTNRILRDEEVDCLDALEAVAIVLGKIEKLS